MGYSEVYDFLDDDLKVKFDKELELRSKKIDGKLRRNKKIANFLKKLAKVFAYPLAKYSEYSPLSIKITIGIFAIVYFIILLNTSMNKNIIGILIVIAGTIFCTTVSYGVLFSIWLITNGIIGYLEVISSYLSEKTYDDYFDNVVDRLSNRFERVTALRDVSKSNKRCEAVRVVYHSSEPSTHDDNFETKFDNWSNQSDRDRHAKEFESASWRASTLRSQGLRKDAEYQDYLARASLAKNFIGKPSYNSYNSANKSYMEAKNQGREKDAMMYKHLMDKAMIDMTTKE